MPEDNQAIIDLADEFERLRRRAGRQKRAICESTTAWQRWSSTIDGAIRVSETLSVTPARSFTDLSMKFATLLRVIEFNNSIIDKDDLRSLRRFRRDLARLAASRTDRHP